jgi:hypothetical protein
MFNLSDPNVSYIVFTPEKDTNTELENKLLCERACSILYSKGYTILSVTGYYEGKYEKSFIAVPESTNNDDLRKDSYYLLDSFHQDSLILKYFRDTSATKVMKDGSERPMSVAYYNENTNNKTYLHNGISFSFIEEKRYYTPKSKSDLKNGMMVEYLNDSVWNQKTILDIDTEYQNLYGLLIKYNKMRVPID